MLLFYQRVLALLTTYLIVKYEFQGNATRSRLREIFNMGMLHTAAIYKVINYEQLLFKALIKIIVINAMLPRYYCFYSEMSAR